MRVLVIEGDIPSARALELILTTEGFNVTLSDSGEEGIDLAKVYDFDVITLDLKLPDMSGFDVIRRLRAAKVNTPVLILSGMALVTDIVKALGAGADDYLTKPAHNDELVARLQTLVRRCKGFAVSVITTGNISLDLSTQTMKISGKSFPLTGKEYAIMELLSLRKGITISKQSFMNSLYGGMDEPEPKIVDVFICKLRKKLRAVNGHPIETVWGRGYVLRDPDAKTMSMAAEVADLSDDPPTGFVPNQTYSTYKEREKAKGVHIKIPATV